MEFLQKLLAVLDTEMSTPEIYGWFHILSLILTAAITVLACRAAKNHSEEKVRKTVLWVALTVLLLEVYKQINYTFSYEGSITADYQWYAFPWQFCSTPMYVGLLAGVLKKGKLQDALLSYLATYAVFAGLCVMAYPGDIYIETVGINIQTTVCHCSMIIVGAYLFASGRVKLEHKTVLRALPVFCCVVAVAAVLNEVAYRVGIVPEETFNMFFISPYCEPSLPVYSLVQGEVPFPLCLVLYVAGFTLAAWFILLLAMAVNKLTGRKVSRFHRVDVYCR